MKDWKVCTPKDISEYLTNSLKDKEYSGYSVNWDILQLIRALFPQDLRDNLSTAHSDSREANVHIYYQSFYLMSITVKKHVAETVRGWGYSNTRKFAYTSLTCGEDCFTTLLDGVTTATCRKDTAAKREAERFTEAFNIVKGILDNSGKPVEKQDIYDLFDKLYYIHQKSFELKLKLKEAYGF